MFTYLVNFAYFLTLCAFLTRDMLYLRCLLVCAQTIIIIYTWHAGVPVISAWNSVFLCINLFMVVQILRERRAVVLPEDLRPLYDRHFAALSPPEFLRWWRQGRHETIDNGPLARAGAHPESLYFLLNGAVRVSRDHVAIADLPAGYFVAEMSLLTGEPATADVDAVGSVDVVRWATRDMRQLRQRNPMLWTKIQSVIGHDLVEKMRLAETHVATPV